MMRPGSRGGPVAAWRRLAAATRMVDPEARAALERRFAELPDRARTPDQVMGRAFIGCEGTHGVFPRCNLTCRPCYHSADANHVRTDGSHTLREVTRQVSLFREHRGPNAHMQLIGGEVSLLDPDDHAATLQAMQQHGRVPMSFTHGDFDYEHLRRIVLDGDGRPRLRRISFAAHFDTTMRGRRSVPRPRRELDLDAARHTFGAMFARLRAEHGVSSFLAHDMTVTPDNLDQVADVVRSAVSAGFGMLSFQPAAYMGDDRRWQDGYRAFTPDDVWDRVAAGVGAPLPWRVLQYGDHRCNRVAMGVLVDGRWAALLDDADPADLRVRDLFFVHLGGANLGDTPPVLFLARLGRLVLTRPALLPVGAAWLARVVRRGGGVRRVLAAAVRGRVRPLTLAMHSFIDAELVGPAWEQLQAGVTAAEPRVREAQERLSACVYSMAHPDTGELIPACVQHSVLDPGENRALRTLLPLLPTR